MVIATGILVSLMFTGLSTTQAGVRNRNGVLFFLCISVSFISMQFIVQVFPHERPIFLKEYGSKLYGVGPYFIGRYISELPSNFIVPILYGTIVYFWIGLDSHEAWKFPQFRKVAPIITK